MAEYTIDIDCVSGQSGPREIVGVELDELLRLREQAAAEAAAAAKAEAEHEEKVTRAKAVLAKNPDLQAVLDALGVKFE